MENNKTIVVTGATGGVGTAIVNLFLKKGWNVVALSKTRAKLDLLQERVASDNLSIIEVDIKDVYKVKRVFSRIKDIDILVNNASIFTSKPFSECSTTEINDILDTNLKGAMFCTLKAVKKMNKGRVINIGSVSGLHGIKNQSIYSASKHGIMGFTESISQEYENILFTTICPGGIDTPLWNESNPYLGDKSKLLKPEDIASLVEYIADAPDNLVLKTMTVFPKNEWH